MFAREGQDTIKPLWNKGSGVLSKGREEVANKSLLGSCHSGVHANDMEIGCFFCSGSIFPGLIHTHLYNEERKTMETGRVEEL